MGRVRNSSSVGQGMTYVSTTKTYNSFVGEWEGLDITKNHLLCIYPKYIVLLITHNLYMFFAFVIVYVSVFVCLFVHKYVVVQLSMSYGNLMVVYEASKR